MSDIFGCGGSGGSGMVRGKCYHVIMFKFIRSLSLSLSLCVFYKGAGTGVTLSFKQ